MVGSATLTIDVSSTTSSCARHAAHNVREDRTPYHPSWYARINAMVRAYHGRVAVMSSDRKDAILQAVERLVLDGGPDAVTMRAVAKEAGVSVRLVQYYGSTKTELLEGALARLSEKSLDQWRSHLPDDATDAQGVLRGFLRTAIPDDDESRRFHRFGVTLEMLAVTD
ncbi:TetR family transcriptional regulator, partial [Salmonella enterica subsp. enterica serovar Enteritidis]|nr:TetR family transcriptional regulator [Salmonella enterica subsp. enterica serovar Enteritidis]